MIKPFSLLSNFIEQQNVIGCFIDTTVLFSATYPLDIFNTESEIVFDIISKQKIAPFTNDHVRSEFLENHRRVLIAECLIDFLEDFSSEIDGVLLEKLKAHRTSYRKKVLEEKSAKMDVGQIKKFRQLLTSYGSAHNNGWKVFCRDYLSVRLEPIWLGTTDIFELNLIPINSNDKNDFMDMPPDWKQAVSLMGHYGVASNDAMILNMFLCSKIPILLTADLEMAEIANIESKGSKEIFVPDSAFLQVAGPSL